MTNTFALRRRASLPSPLLTLLATLLAAQAGIASAQATFKCKDEKGGTHYYTGMPPPQCEKAPLTEMSPTGRVKGVIEPGMTPEQKKAMEATAAERKEQEKKNAEQERKDKALMATYGSEKEFEVSRQKAIADVEERSKSTVQRLTELDAEIKKLDKEMEFYEAGKSAKATTSKAPPTLLASLKKAKDEKAALREKLQVVETEKVAVNERFDADIKRWKAIRTGEVKVAGLSEGPEVLSSSQLTEKLKKERCAMATSNMRAAETGVGVYQTEWGRPRPLNTTRDRAAAAEFARKDMDRYCK